MVTILVSDKYSIIFFVPFHIAIFYFFLVLAIMPHTIDFVAVSIIV